jgi:hypothetical protein
MGIDEFIKIVAPKLKMPVVRSFETMKGSDLKLTGYKEVKGKPIDDHKIYKIPTPAVVKVNHERKLRLAWLRGGRQAVRNYLNRYFKVDDVTKVIEVLRT